MDIPNIEKLRGHYLQNTEDDDCYFEAHEFGDCVQYNDAKHLYDAALFWKAQHDNLLH